MNNKNIMKNRYQGLKSLSRTLDNFFNDMWWPISGIGETWEEFRPQSKLTEDKDKYYVEIDLPGIKKEEVRIEVVENTLSIRGERKDQKKQENAKQHYSEVFYGSFTREFVLPTSVEKESIEAHYEDGVLFITIPKSTQSKVHQINIK